MFDIVNLLFKDHGGGNRRPNVVVFVVWSALIVGGWLVVDRKSYLGPAEISPLCVPGLIRGLGMQGESKISSCCF